MTHSALAVFLSRRVFLSHTAQRDTSLTHESPGAPQSSHRGNCCAPTERAYHTQHRMHGGAASHMPHPALDRSQWCGLWRRARGQHMHNLRRVSIRRQCKCLFSCLPVFLFNLSYISRRHVSTLAVFLAQARENPLASGFLMGRFLKCPGSGASA